MVQEWVFIPIPSQSRVKIKGVSHPSENDSYWRQVLEGDSKWNNKSQIVSVDTKVNARVFVQDKKLKNASKPDFLSGCWRWSKDPNSSVFLINQADRHLVFKRVVLPVDVHGRVVCRPADFTGQPLLISLFVLHGDQVAIGGHAEIVFLQQHRVSERCPLDPHRASDRGEEADFLAIEPGRLLLLTWRAAAEKEKLVVRSLKVRLSLQSLFHINH